MLSRGFERAVGAAVIALCGCSSFVGGLTASRDAGDDALDGDDAPSVDVRPDASTDVAGFAWCGMTFSACDPTTSEGCASSESCVIEQLRPPVARCAVASDRPEGARCGAGFGGCARGLQCLAGRCLRPCCFDRGANTCGARSTCAVYTEATFIRGCTLRGACDYLTQEGCDSGYGCFPRSDHGEAECLPFGAAGAGRFCSAANDCVAGYTCRSLMGASSYCARICNPERNTSAGCICEEFMNRPADFGGCR